MAGLPEGLRVRTLGLPRWVWLTAIGSGLIIGVYLRSRSTGEDTEEEAVTDEPYEVGNAEGAFSPAFGIGGYGGGGYTGIDGTVGSTYEDYMGSAIELSRSMVDAYAGGLQAAWEQMLGYMTEMQRNAPSVPSITDPVQPLPDQPAAPGGPPAAPARPAPAAPQKPSNYHAGNHLRNGSGTVSHTVPGASGWIQLRDESNEYADFHVAFPNGRLQRWRLWGNGSHVRKGMRGKKQMIWEGAWR